MPGHDVDAPLGKGVAVDLSVVAGGTTPQVERSFRASERVPRVTEGAEEPVSLAGQLRHVDRHALQRRDAVLHERVREAPADGELDRQECAAQLLPLGARKEGRQREVAEALTGGEQNLAVAVVDHRPRIRPHRAREADPVEADPPVRLVGQQPDPAPVGAGCLLQHACELVPCLLREHPAGGVRGRVDDHDACARRDRTRDRIDVEREVRRVQCRRDGNQVGRVQHRVVAEPPGCRDDDFVAGVGDQGERERDRPNAP